MATAAELRQILKQDAAGKNLYDHLTETLLKILIDKPANSYDQFEIISSDVKAKPFNPDPEAGRAVPPSEEEVRGTRSRDGRTSRRHRLFLDLCSPSHRSPCPLQYAKKFSWSKKCAALLKVPDEPPEDTGVKLPDLLDEANLLEWAGVSVGRYEAHRLFLSMKKLSESLPGDVGKLRFFGKIYTRGHPYVIVEGLSPEDEEGIDDKLQEGRGGANKNAYWVARGVEVAAAEDWVKLPNVTMAQVVVSRKIKRLLTGDLDAPVPSFPPFPGTERHLLRALIARIVGATLISPDGFFELSDDDPPVAKEAEAEALNERFPKPAADIKEAEAWRHHEVELNALGRVLPMPEVRRSGLGPLFSLFLACVLCHCRVHPIAPPPTL